MNLRYRLRFGKGWKWLKKGVQEYMNEGKGNKRGDAGRKEMVEKEGL